MPAAVLAGSWSGPTREALRKDERMPWGDGSKERCFQLWLQGRSVDDMAKRVPSERHSIRNWVLDWERGKQRKWRAEVRVKMAD